MTFIEIETDHHEYHPYRPKIIPVDLIGEIRPTGDQRVTLLDRNGEVLGEAAWSKVAGLIHGDQVMAAQPGWRVVRLVSARELAYAPIIGWRVSSCGVTPITPHGWLNQDLDQSRCSALALPPEGQGDAYDVCPLDDGPAIIPPDEESMRSWLRSNEARRIARANAAWLDDPDDMPFGPYLTPGGRDQPANSV